MKRVHSFALLLELYLLRAPRHFSDTTEASSGNGTMIFTVEADRLTESRHDDVIMWWPRRLDDMKP